MNIGGYIYRAIILAAVRISVSAFQLYRQFVLISVRVNGSVIKYASVQLRDDREVVLAAVRVYGCALQYASEQLRGDHEIVLAAVRVNGSAFKYASEQLRGDREIVLEAVRKNRFALKYASDELRGNPEFVLAAVRVNVSALYYASNELRRDPEFVLTAVRVYGYALKYASEELRRDPEFVLEAVRVNGWALEYASDELRGRREFVLEAVRVNGYALNYASEELRGRREFVLTAVRVNGYALYYASDELRGDREVVLAAVRVNGYALEYASDELRDDREFVLAAVRVNGSALYYASDHLRGDCVFALEIAIVDPSALVHLTVSLNSDISSVALASNTPAMRRVKGMQIAIRNDAVDSVSRLLKVLNDSSSEQSSAGEAARADIRYDTVSGHGTYLHYAAAMNRLEICKLLFDAGVPLLAQNDQGHTAEVVARKKNHEEVAQFLIESRNVFSAGAGGRGDALDEALSKEGRVEEVVWYKINLPDPTVTRIGAFHSLIVVSVRDDTNQQLSRYVMERVERKEHNGIMISHWRDVEHKVSHVIHNTGIPIDAPQQWTVKALFNIAMEQGPYNVRTNNCHHLCRRIFNEVIAESERVEWTPNWHLAYFAFVAASQSPVESRCGALGSNTYPFFENDSYHLSEAEVQLARNSSLLADWIYQPDDLLAPSIVIQNFTDESLEIGHSSAKSRTTKRIEPGQRIAISATDTPTAAAASTTNDAGTLYVQRLGYGFGYFRRVLKPLRMQHGMKYVIEEGDADAKESFKYSALDIPTQPDANLTTVAVFKTGSGSGWLVQWAIVISDQYVFVVFRGTASFNDALTDAAATPIDFYGDKSLGVHNGVWGQLHASRFNVVEKLREELAALNQLGEKQLVMCGHSLGGGYAILCALEFLHQQEYEVHQVLAFGCPQVIAPSTIDSPLWQKLNAVTKVFINEWDVVPRMFSCRNWLHIVAPKGMLQMDSGYVRFGLQLPRGVIDKAVGDQEVHWQGYRHVGMLLFIGKGRPTAMLVPSVVVKEGGGTVNPVWLEEAEPLESGSFIVKHHKLYSHVINALQPATS